MNSCGRLFRYEDSRCRGTRSKTRGVIAGLVTGDLDEDRTMQIIEMAGTTPAMTKRGCFEFCPGYMSRRYAFALKPKS